MAAFIHHIETLVPEFCYSQDYAAERMQAWAPDRQTARLARAVYGRSGIDRRYSVLPDFMPGAAPRLFRIGPDGHPLNPSTQERNRYFIEAAGRLSVEAARRVFATAPGFGPADVTHVITASCTGFYNPGPDYQIVTALGLPASTERYHLGFMGCYAAFPALRMAQQFCAARPDAVVLIVCLELCSLHLQIRFDPDSLLANALFADGVAAALVSARPPAPAQAALRLDEFLAALAPEGKRDMAWELGNTGFNIVLSSYVPDVIAANVAGIVDDLLLRGGGEREEIDIWAIHPGGKAILDKVERALGLRPEQLRASRETLRDYGNMSSATILFVLERLLHPAAASQSSALQRPARSQRICAMAFGPGLVIESALLQLMPVRTTTERLFGEPSPALPAGDVAAGR